jgi:hypothetical protein
MTRQTVRCRFRVGADRVPSLWNAENGNVTPCHVYAHQDGFSELTLDLDPASSIFVVFAENASRHHLVESKEPQNGNLPSAKILAYDQKGLDVEIWQPGEYAWKNTMGHTITMEEKELPAARQIMGNWRVEFPKDRGAPASIAMKTLADWTKHPDAGVRYFSGTAVYHNKFSLPVSHDRKSPLLLDLGVVKEVAVVKINGKEAGVLWKEPYRLDITTLAQAGENQLEISVTNTWNNRLVGDRSPDSGERVTRTNLSGKFSASSPLLPSGLIGPVMLRQGKVIRVNGP